MRNGWMRMWLPALMVSATMVWVGCGGSDAERAGKTRVVTGDGSSRFPSATLEDWKSYSDHLATFSVVADEAQPLDPEEKARGEGMIGREVTLRVEQTHWSAAGAPALPDEIKMRAAGWVLEDGRQYEFSIDGSPRVEVGQMFVAPLVQVEEPSLEWWPLDVGAQLPVREGRIVPEPSQTTPVAREFTGRTVAELTDALTARAPHPLAEKHRRLRPTKRVKAVLQEGGFDGP